MILQTQDTTFEVDYLIYENSILHDRSKLCIRSILQFPLTAFEQSS